MKLRYVLLLSAALMVATATWALACPDGASAGAECPAHNPHAQRAASASAGSPAPQPGAPATALAIHATTPAAMPAANRTQRCQSFAQACDAAPRASANHGACCDDGSSATHASARSTSTPASSTPAKTGGAARPAARNAGAGADAPAFGPLFLAHRTLML